MGEGGSSFQVSRKLTSEASIRLALCGLSDAKDEEGVLLWRPTSSGEGLIAKDGPPGSTPNPKGLLPLLEALGPMANSQRQNRSCTWKDRVSHW